MHRGGPWLDRARPRHRALAPASRSTTKDSSPCSPAPCARWREPRSAVPSSPANRTKFQVIALLVREERQRAKAGADERRRARRDAQAARRRRDHPRQDRRARHDPHRAAGERQGRERRREGAAPPHARGRRVSPSPRRRRRPRPSLSAAPVEKQVMPDSVRARQLANPFLAPDFAAAASPRLCLRAGSRTGSCSARCSRASSTARTAAPRAWSCPIPRPRSLRPLGCRAHAPPGGLHRERRSADTAPSCSPTSRASARPRRA